MDKMYVMRTHKYECACACVGVLCVCCLRFPSCLFMKVSSVCYCCSMYHRAHFKGTFFFFFFFLMLLRSVLKSLFYVIIAWLCDLSALIAHCNMNNNNNNNIYIYYIVCYCYCYWYCYCCCCCCC